MHTLVITGPDKSSRTEQLEPGTTTIGRSDNNGIVLNHPNVSRSHAEIRLDDTGAQISDTGSANGTRVNGRKLDPGEWAALRADDRVDIGVFSMAVGVQDEGPETVYLDRTVFTPRFEAAAPPPPPPAPPPPVQAVMPAPSPVPPSPPRPPPPPAPPLEPVAFPAAVDEPSLPPAPPLQPVAVPIAPEEPPPSPPAARPRPAPGAALPSRQKEKLALVLLVLAALLTLPASFATWDQRVLLNENRFVKVGNEVLAEPGVQREMARQLAIEVDKTSTNDLLKDIGIPDLGIPDDIAKTGLDILDEILGTGPKKQPAKSGATPAPRSITSEVVEEIMLGVIQALPNTSIADSSLRTTHRAVVTAIRTSAIATKDDKIIIDVSDGMSQLFSTVGILGVSPVDLSKDLGRVEIARTEELSRLLNLGRRLDGLYLPLLALVLAGLAGSVYLAPDRPRHLTRAGVALIVAAVAWIGLVLVPMKPWVLDKAVQDPMSRPAADAAYGVVSGTFVNQEIYLAAGGVALLLTGLYMASRARRAAEPGPHPDAA